MRIRTLGKTEINVTELGFGTLPMGPLQLNVALEDGVGLIRKALECGINFFDTADSYGTYKYLAPAFKDIKKGGRDGIVIATKTHAMDYDTAKQHVERALKELGVEYIDIFHLHAARDLDPFNNRKGAWECLLHFKEKGLIRAVGVATHSVKVVREAAPLDGIDVVFPLVNKVGLGIIDGTTDDMLDAMQRAKAGGKGVYAMKVLAGGVLINKIPESISFIREKEYIDAIALGMVNEAELETNLKLFEGESVQVEEFQMLKRRKKLVIMNFCKKCGNCISECPNGALSMGENKPEVDTDKCILCGYCSRVCKELAIRMQ
jgi:aryl-alcohol dehydrogenase-like predicted oxidoreductase/NAD-dependent dihydropyrimidine dehydrogenase PreA subunit